MDGRGRSATSEVTKTMSPRCRRSVMAGTRARTSRWVPLRLTGQHAVERLGVGVEHRPGDVLGGVGHHDLDGTEGVHRRLGELLDRIGVGQVEVDGHRLAAVGPDGGGGVLALGHPPGPEGHRVALGGQGPGRGLADARRRPGHHGRAPFGVGLEPGHQRRVTVVGRAARPRTLMEWTRSMPSGSTS